MKFLKKRWVFNSIIAFMCISDIIIAFLINKLSGTPFSLRKTENVIASIVLVILVICLIFCNIWVSHPTKNAKPKKLQKAFQECGGYEAAANELKACIHDGNFKKLRDIKKMVKTIEQ